MSIISLPWVSNLLEDLRSKTGERFSIDETKSSVAAIVTYEMPPRISIYDDRRNTIFEFVTDIKKLVFNCDLARYPCLKGLISRHCPARGYRIVDPWKREREKRVENTKRRI